MKIKKVYLSVVVKFPKLEAECYVHIDYESKFFTVYYGKELTDEQYDSLRTRFKIDDCYTRICEHLGDVNLNNIGRNE